MAVIKLTKENFEEVALRSEKVVLVDFYADWCGPCKMAAPIVEELSGELADAVFCKVNVDDSPELAAAFGVQSIPTFVVLSDGKAVDMSVGFRSKADLEAMIAAAKD